MSVRVAWTRKRDEVGSLAGFSPPPFVTPYFLLIVIFEQPPAREPFFPPRVPERTAILTLGRPPRTTKAANLAGF